MQYRIIDHCQAPLSDLYLESMYELKNADAESIYGCTINGKIGISIILAGESHLYVQNRWVKQPAVSVYGLVKKVQFHKMGKGYHEINLAFKPYLLQLFLRHSMSSLLPENATDLRDLLDPFAVEQLYEAIATAGSHAEIVRRAEVFLQQQVKAEKLDSRLAVAHDLIHHQQVWSVSQLSDRLNLSPAWLRNLFRDKMGISPKDLIKIVRIKKALSGLANTEESLTDLAYQLDYYDQAHFIHEFKDAIGLSPRKYFSNKNLTFDFYNFERWRVDSFAGSNDAGPPIPSVL